jgi:UDP-N-acetylglucosamine 2-epimerase (non-hydrolysing)/GDP/UDP-N,N'-diacetylbacillosamine 2-epimerase (hydrolysing)
MDYGLITPVLDAMQQRDNVDVRVIAFGTHVDGGFDGRAVDDVLGDDLSDVVRLSTVRDDNSAIGVARSFAVTAEKLSQALDEMRPDVIVIPGDRYEMLACASAANILDIPIVHLYGGDVSYGASDESFRHAITKLSHMHFVSHDDARRRVLQMGENPDYVFNYGAPALSYLDDVSFWPQEKLCADLDIAFGDRNILFTYHSATREDEDFDAVIEALGRLDEDVHIFATVPNVDYGGREIYRALLNFIENRPKAWVFNALGTERYLSLMHYVDAVVGNSSSGLYEAPSVGTPTVNIGDRQEGRAAVDSVIHCACDTDGIISAIEKAFSFDCSGVENPYYQPDSAARIADQILALYPFTDILKKRFFDYG